MPHFRQDCFRFYKLCLILSSQFLATFVYLLVRVEVYQTVRQLVQGAYFHSILYDTAYINFYHKSPLVYMHKIAVQLLKNHSIISKARGYSFGVQGVMTFESTATDQLVAVNQLFLDFFQKSTNAREDFYRSIQLRTITNASAVIRYGTPNGQYPKTPVSSSKKMEIRYTDFSICEVVAFLLDEELQMLMKEKTADEISQKQLGSVFLFRLEEYVSKIVSLASDKIVSIKNAKQMLAYRKNALFWEMIINIRRRYYQILRGKTLSHGTLLKYFANENILNLYEDVSSKLTNLIIDQNNVPRFGSSPSSPFNDKCLELIDQLCQKRPSSSPPPPEADYLEYVLSQGHSQAGKFHYLVGDEFRAMYSKKLAEQCYSPFVFLQDRFKNASGLKENSSTQINTVSFIVTNLTAKIFQRLAGHQALEPLFLNGVKYMGKSMSLHHYTTLSSYTGSRVVFVPNLMMMNLKNLYISLFEGLWSGLSLETLKSMRDISKNKSPNESDIMDLLNCCITPQIGNSFIIDQFSSFVNFKFRESLNEAFDPDNQHNLLMKSKFLWKLFKLPVKTVLSSSISVERKAIKAFMNFIIPQQEKHIEVTESFKGIEAHHILQLWIQKLGGISPFIPAQIIKFTRTLVEKIQLFGQRSDKEANMDQIKEIAKKILEFVYVRERADVSSGGKTNVVNLQDELNLKVKLEELYQSALIEWYAGAIKRWTVDSLPKGVKSSITDMRVFIIKSLLLSKRIESYEIVEQEELQLPRFMCDSDGKLLIRDEDVVNALKIKTSHLSISESTYMKLIRKPDFVEGRMLGKQLHQEFSKQLHHENKIFITFLCEKIALLKSDQPKVTEFLIVKAEQKAIKFMANVTNKIAEALYKYLDTSQSCIDFIIETGEEKCCDGMIIRAERKTAKKDFSLKIVILETGLNKQQVYEAFLTECQEKMKSLKELSSKKQKTKIVTDQELSQSSKQQQKFHEKADGGLQGQPKKREGAQSCKQSKQGFPIQIGPQNEYLFVRSNNGKGGVSLSMSVCTEHFQAAMILRTKDIKMIQQIRIQLDTDKKPTLMKCSLIDYSECPSLSRVQLITSTYESWKEGKFSRKKIEELIQQKTAEKQETSVKKQ